MEKLKENYLYVDELPMLVFILWIKKLKHSMINIGSGKDSSIKDFTKLILKIIIPNKKISIKYDLTKPNGTPRKVLDISLAKKYGWKPNHNLKTQILKTYNSYLSK